MNRSHPTMKPLVVFLLTEYPQLSQTYKENEARALMPYCEVKIISLASHDTPYKDHLPFEHAKSKQEALQICQKLKPHIIHSHYLHLTHLAHKAALLCGCKYTIRTHSFDVIGKHVDYLSQYKDAINSDRCCGIICFPFLKKNFVEAGIKSHKIFTSYPVVDVKRFANRGDNGQGILNVGAAIPKKNMQEFFFIADKNPGITFNLYAIGYNVEELKQQNNSIHNRVNIKKCVEPWLMAREYKQHHWLLYTACPYLKTVGWPMAIAEAQASGLGILMRNIRPDLKEYIGGAGFLYNTPDEASNILRNKYPEDMREKGFKIAERSSLNTHLQLLQTIWSQ